MIQEQEKYVINYNSVILFQLVYFFFDISVVFFCMQDQVLLELNNILITQSSIFSVNL